MIIKLSTFVNQKLNRSLICHVLNAGIPWLKYIMDQVGDLVHFWPFDGFDIPPEESMIAEVYPAIFRNRYPRDDRNSDEHDAYAIAMWLKQMDGRGLLQRYFNPHYRQPNVSKPNWRAGYWVLSDKKGQTRTIY